MRYINLWSDLEAHHIWRKNDLKELLDGEPFPIDCVVPVHKKSCHRKKLQDYADTAGRQLLDAGKLSTTAFDQTCINPFLEGNLDRNVFLREWARRERPEDQRKHVIFQLNALTGSQLGAILAYQTGSTGVTWLAGSRIPHDPVWLLYSGSVLMSGGYRDAAAVRFGEFESSIPRWRRCSSEPYIVYARRRAIMSCRVNDSKDAVKLAKEQKEAYVMRTALVSLGWAYFGARNYGAARDAFEDILSWPGRQSMSWWHVAEQQFGLGCAVYFQEGANSTKRAVRNLLTSQYIFAMLGLQGIPVPDPRKETQDGPCHITPTNVLHWLCNLHAKELPRRQMVEIRREMIVDSGLRDALCNTLTRPNVTC